MKVLVRAWGHPASAGCRDKQPNQQESQSGKGLATHLLLKMCPGPVASTSPGAHGECRVSGPTPEPLKQNQHLHKLSRWVVQAPVGDVLGVPRTGEPRQPPASAHHLCALQMLQADLFPCEVWFLTFGLFPGKEQYICF